MPFEFTGVAPPRLDAPSSFSSFAIDSTTGFASTAPRIPAIPTPWLSASTTSTSGFGHFGQTRLQLSGPQPSAIRNDFGVVTPPAATNALTKALVRALRDRPAVWGWSEIAGDQVITDTLKETFDIPTILSGLRQVEQTNPDVARFILALFDSAVQSRMPTKWLETKLPTTSTTSSADLPRSDQVADNDAPSAQARGHSTTSSAPSARANSSDHVKVPRRHPRVVSFVEALAARILRGAAVKYPEGAKVLAGHITDLYYAGLSQGDVVAALLSLLGRPDNVKEVADIASYADDGLDALETQYESNKEDMDREASDEEAPNDKDANGALDEDSSSEADSDSESLSPVSKPFRFLELPAEMRNLIYQLLLAPDGHIGLTKLVHAAEARHLKDVVVPDAVPQPNGGANYYKLSSCTPQILAVCRQIYEEAKQIMYEENTVCATVAIASGVLILDKCLLPDSTLPRLTSLMLVCDAAESSAMDPEWFSQLPWKQLQDLTGLKSLRISLIERESESNITDSKAWILENILERVPAACQVTFESREGFEDTYVQEVIDETQAQMTFRRRVRVDNVYEVEGGILQELAKQYTRKQGRKSGHERDYRFPDRSISTVVGKLMPLSGVDPNLVLGGQFR